MKEIDQFESFLQERFEHFEEMPAPSSWQEIQERLHRKKRRPVIFWWIPVAASALLLVGCYFYFQKKQPDNFVEKTNVTNPVTSTSSTATNEVTVPTNSSTISSTTANTAVNNTTTKNITAPIPNTKKTYEITKIQGQTDVYHEVPNTSNTNNNISTNNINITNSKANTNPTLHIVFLPTMALKSFFTR